MPFLAPLVPVLTAVAAAGTIGSTIYGLTQGGGGGGGQQQTATPQQSAATSSTNPQQQQAETAAIARQVPNVQSQLGGSVSPDYYAEEAAREAGFPGDSNIAKAALNQFLGLGSTPDNMGISPGEATSSQSSPFSPLSIHGNSSVDNTFFGDILGNNNQVSGGYS